MSFLTYLSITFAAAILIVFFYNPKKSGMLLLGAILLLPYISTPILTFRIELFIEPILLIFILINRQGCLMLPYSASIIFIFFFWLLFTTVLSGIVGVQGELLIVSLYSYLRPIIVILIFYNLRFTIDETYQLLRIFIYSALPLGLLAVFQVIGNEWVTFLTLEGYTSFHRTSAENLIEYSGKISRGIAVFETPSYAAIYFLLVLGAAIHYLMELHDQISTQNRRLVIISLCAALLGGVATLSTTFIAGCIGLFLWLLVSSEKKYRAKVITYVVTSTFLLAILVPIVMKESMGSLTYQLNRIMTLTLFQTRYDSNEGQLSEMTTAILEKPLLGWGMRAQENIFLGDSMYLLLVYYSGLIGLLLFFLALISIMFLARHTGLVGKVSLCWLFLLLIAGLGSPSFVVPRLYDWWWAMVGVMLFGSKYWLLNSNKSIDQGNTLS